MENITITINRASDEDGYLYDIYLATPEEIESGADSEDGGMCTSTIAEALDMARDQAQLLINRHLINA